MWHKTVDYLLEPVLYVIITIFYPLGHVLWIYSLSLLLFPEKAYKISLIFLIVVIPYNIYLLTGLLIYPSLIMRLEGKFNLEIVSPIVFFYTIFYAILVMYLIVLLTVRSLQSGDPKIQLRGKLLFLGTLLALDILIDAYIPLTEFSVVFIRLLLIASSILYYIGLILPEKVSNWLTRSKNQVLKGKGLKKHDFQEILEMMSKPRKVLEEEVKVYREKMVCLVCKNQLVGFRYNYICPSCRALYCENCAQAIIQLENVCWVCSAPIDASKPIKPYVEKKIEEQDVIKETLKK